MAKTQIPHAVRNAVESGSVAGTVGNAVRYANGVQDHLVTRYFDRYSVALTYYAFAFVFAYLGLQKVVPHRSTADVQLATIAGLVGLPYIPFVTFVGVWQMTIGVLFLLRRLRACAWFFFSYQVFTFSTLVVLREIVFQPPWVVLWGVEIPWALGAYAAFILKNLIFAAIFFVLASHELDTTPGGGSSEGAGASGYRRPSARWPAGVSGGRLSGLAGYAGAARRRVATLVGRVHAGQNRLVTRYFRPHGVSILYATYAFVWFYFGFQKPAPVISPVRTPLGDFFPHFGIPLVAGMVFIGFYEMFLGLLLAFREIRIAFWLFFAHQAVTFFTLLVIPFVAFQPPWISVFDVRFPWALTGYGAFVVKNVVFVAGFALLASIELGDATVDEPAE